MSLFLHRTGLASAAQSSLFAEFIDTDGSADNLTTYTLNDVAIGGAHPNREVFLLVHSRSSSGAGRNIVSASIGGVSADIHVERTTGGFSNELYVGLISAPVPTGTTAQVVIEFDNGCTEIDIGVIRAINLASRTAHDTANVFATEFPDTLDVSVNTQAGGFVIAGSVKSSGTLTWGGVTEEYDETGTGGNIAISGGLATDVAAETPRTVTVTTAIAAVAASFL